MTDEDGGKYPIFAKGKNYLITQQNITDNADQVLGHFCQFLCLTQEPTWVPLVSQQFLKSIPASATSKFQNIGND